MRWITAWIGVVSCAREGALPPRWEAPVEEPHTGPGNILLFLADDLGIDRLESYGVGEAFPSTPTIDGLAADGVRYTRVWAQSLCSPGRAAIQTGRQPYQTGIGHALSAHTTNPLDDAEVTLPELIGDSGYASAYVGKWHLSSTRLPESGYYHHPNDQGWDSFDGLMVGLDDEIAFDEGAQSWFDWERTIDGVPSRSPIYVTTANANAAIDAISELPEPWIVQVAFMAPHAPLHWPPDRLWDGEEVGATDPQRKTNAMIEAMDAEMGRVIEALGPRAARTTVVFTSDNGTEPAAVSAPYDAAHAKGTPYEGGVRVPLVVSGYKVGRQGERCDHLVQTTDLFASIAELAEVAVDPALTTDSVSFVPSLGDPDAAPARTLAFAEQFEPSGPGPYDEHFLAIRDDRYKLVRWYSKGDEEEPAFDETMFFDLGSDAAEGPDLFAGGLDADRQQAFDALTARLPTRFP